MARFGRSFPIKPHIGRMPVSGSGAIAYTQTFNETVTPSDTILRATTRILTDSSITLSEVFSKIYGRYRTYTDALFVMDTQSNYLVNPSFETNINFITYGTAIPTLDTSTGFIGSNSLRYIATISDDHFWYTIADGLPTQVVNANYTFSIYLKGSGTVRLWVYDGVSNQFGSNITLTSTWTRYTLTTTCAGQGMLAGVRQVTSCDLNADAAMFEPGGVANTYVDGSQSGGIWSGTANASTSYSNRIILAIGRILSDTATISDAIGRAITRIASDTTTLTDSIVKSTTRILSDASISLTDSFATVYGRYRSYSETVSLIDTLSRAVTKTASETVTLSETISKAGTRILSDTATVSDSIKKAVTRSLSDASVTLSDTFATVKGYFRTLTDTTTLSDTVVKSVTRIFSDASITLSDTMNKVISGGISFTETINISDTISKAATRIFSESATISEVFAVVIARLRTFSETITLSEVFSILKARFFSETITLHDFIFGWLNGVNMLWHKVSRVITGVWTAGTKQVGTWIKEEKPEE
jgi:hypothetical protein